MAVCLFFIAKASLSLRWPIYITCALFLFLLSTLPCASFWGVESWSTHLQWSTSMFVNILYMWSVVLSTLQSSCMKSKFSHTIDLILSSFIVIANIVNWTMISYGNPINQSDHVLHIVGFDNKSFKEKRNQNQTDPKQI